MGIDEQGADFTVDFILDVINEVRSMRKYLSDTEQIDTIIEELNSMLKYANPTKH